jgi:multidrug efflux pump subunit AcrA (membrane-fusion protein)
VAGGLAWRHYVQADRLPDWVVRSNGRIEMTRTDIAVKYPGRLVSLLVHEGDVVQAGQVIAQQDDADALAQLDGARAAREGRRAGSNGRKANRRRTAARPISPGSTGRRPPGFMIARWFPMSSCASAVWLSRGRAKA